MSLPNLSQLRVTDTGATLFEYLVEQRANKGDCTRHVDLSKSPKTPGQRPSAPGPFTPAAMVETMKENVRRWEAKKQKYDDDLAGQFEQSVNCAIDGYMMYKPVPGAVDVSTLAPDYLEKPLQLTLSDGTPLTLPTLNDPIKRIPGNENDAARAREFEKANPTWVSDVFTDACKPSPKGKSIIRWSGYGVELSGATDWYYLHDESGVNSNGQPERKTGHLFLQLFDSQEMKVGKHMPTAGKFSGRYLYIGLVCGLGLGKKFMEIAYAASKALGCDGIALATMVNSAGFYYSSQGFQFMDKVTGNAIDVSQYTEQRMVNDRPKAILLENYDPDDPRGQMRARDDADAAALEQAGDRASRRRRQTLARLSYFA
tara:strand:+ start:197 stop:1309 length:1113 start_codon:yes stop_codon:yes gene_type:complete